MSSASHDVDWGPVTWPEKTQLYFIDLMEGEARKGNRHTSTFTRAAWKFMENELKKKTGREYTHEQLKNKFNQLRQRWRDLSSLLTDTTVEYVASTGQISATEDAWNELCATHKHARYFRRKGCKGYDKLCVIFGDSTTAIGDNAHPFSKSPIIDENDREKEGDEEVESSQAKKKVKVANERIPLRQQVQSGMADGLTSMEENTRKKMERRGRKMSLTSEDSHISGARQTILRSKEEQGVVNCIIALSALEGIDSAHFSKAAHVLHDDALWRVMFLAMPDKRKKDWVLSLS
ncbi:uncharacterized protein A4U43_C07F29390 [Asparagus officinalis]|uniref:Myb/SANT-like domain-containing protein n=1 Tax=Asparagus officinalis TaxID=4686 RepID=A0A5P1EJG9_ASPOF|nr:uncharacterized protein LOC109850409 [Asparagus officinalis]ONK64741.1 uncharacterized protein A4U43_C07F29390 [Asparagus officinalis]